MYVFRAKIEEEEDDDNWILPGIIVKVGLIHLRLKCFQGTTLKYQIISHHSNIITIQS